MAQYEESESVSSLSWLLTGVVIGAVLGVLYAPRAGHETRTDIGDYARHGGQRARGLASRIGERIPARIKAAAGFGAIKGAGREAIREGKEKLEDRLS